MSSTNLRRTCQFVAIAAIAIAMIDAGPADGQSGRVRDAAEGRADGASEEAGLRLREDMRLDHEIGEFWTTGERIRFYSKNRGAFIALENLALERVSRVLDEHVTPRQWSVSGVVKEYRGGNYLLITRAVLKATNSRQPADAVKSQ